MAGSPVLRLHDLPDAAGEESSGVPA
jgi:hypothetical protein